MLNYFLALQRRHSHLYSKLLFKRNLEKLFMALGAPSFRLSVDADENLDDCIKKAAKQVLGQRAYTCSHPLERTF